MASTGLAESSLVVQFRRSVSYVPGLFCQLCTRAIPRLRLTIAQRGILVTDVVPLGPAQDRLGERDVITDVIVPAPRRQISTPAQLQQALAGLKRGEYISLSVFSLDDPTHSPRIVHLRIGE